MRVHAPRQALEPMVADAFRPQGFKIGTFGFWVETVFPLRGEAAARGGRRRPERFCGVEVRGRVLGPRGRRGDDGEEPQHAWLIN